MAAATERRSVLVELKRISISGLDVSSERSLASAERLLESGKAMMIAMADRFIAEAGMWPLLISYSNDGTGLKSKRSIELKTAQGRKSRRVGKQYYEVLVQNAFLRYLDQDGEGHSLAILRDALPMAYGKSGDATWACARDWVPATPLTAPPWLGVVA